MALPKMAKVRIGDTWMSVDWDTPVQFKFREWGRDEGYNIAGKIFPSHSAGCVYFLPNEPFDVPRAWTRSRKHPGAFECLRDYIWLDVCGKEDDAVTLEGACDLL